jgi:putative two-component system response regulator
MPLSCVLIYRGIKCPLRPKMNNTEFVVKKTVRNTPKRKILLVEDHLPTAMSLVASLSTAQCDMDVVTSSDTAIETCQDRIPEIIVIDVDIIGSGFELFQRLREITALAHIPIVFVARHFDDAQWRRGLQMGAADYIERPFGGPAFTRRLLSHIRPQKMSF